MQAIFLAAGRGSRLQPLTNHVPKAMIRIEGKNLIEHNISKLPKEIDEIILVINYLSEQIINHFGKSFAGRKIKYIKQEKLLGTGHALHQCKDDLRGRFLVLMGDDIYHASDIKKSLKNKRTILTKEIKKEFTGGRIALNKKGDLDKIIEGQHKCKVNLVNTGLYVLDKNFFKYKLVKLKNKNEYGLPQTMVKMAKDYPIKIEKAFEWMQINDINGLKKAKKLIT